MLCRRRWKIVGTKARRSKCLSLVASPPWKVTTSGSPVWAAIGRARGGGGRGVDPGAVDPVRPAFRQSLEPQQRQADVAVGAPHFAGLAARLDQRRGDGRRNAGDPDRGQPLLDQSAIAGAGGQL